MENYNFYWTMSEQDFEYLCWSAPRGGINAYSPFGAVYIGAISAEIMIDGDTPDGDTCEGVGAAISVLDSRATFSATPIADFPFDWFTTISIPAPDRMTFSKWKAIAEHVIANYIKSALPNKNGISLIESANTPRNIALWGEDPE